PGGFGSEGFGPGDFGKIGGPFGFGSSPGAGPGLSADSYGDALILVGKIVNGIGLTVATVGVGAAVGPGTQPLTPSLVVEGFAIGLAGALLVDQGTKHNESTSNKTITVPVVVIDDSTDDDIDDSTDDDIDDSTDNNTKDPKQPRKTDLYPDPDGGGSGDPTQMWDEFGEGGNPNTMWDDSYGGGLGGPNMIWDEKFGGEGPTMKPMVINASVMTGSGLLSGVTRIGPATFTF
ncbi:hypothetical protein COL35_04375, partial [Bacillus toyonensis]|uniref:hypothetical protein n=1 Tax=Bacillus toyonensis TaxID=155322 RepID=UPI000C01BD6D